MRGSAALALLAAALLAPPAAATPLPGRDAGEFPVELSHLPASVDLPRYAVAVRSPAGPDAQAGGGSGGPVIEIEIRQRAGPLWIQARAQAIALWVADRGDAPPEFSVWSKTGAATPVFCRLRLQGSKYCIAYCEDYEQREDGLNRTDAPRRTIGCE